MLIFFGKKSRVYDSFVEATVMAELAFLRLISVAPRETGAAVVAAYNTLPTDSTAGAVLERA